MCVHVSVSLCVSLCVYLQMALNSMFAVETTL